MNHHNAFILLAIERAKENAKAGGYPFGAVIVKDGQVVGQSNVDDQAFDPTAHAELSAIRNACKNLKAYDLTGCKIYSSCHPCQQCLGAIKWVGIKEIFYAMDKDDAHTIGLADDIFMDDTVEVIKNKIQHAELLGFMQSWYKQKKLDNRSGGAE